MPTARALRDTQVFRTRDGAGCMHLQGSYTGRFRCIAVLVEGEAGNINSKHSALCYRNASNFSVQRSIAQTAFVGRESAKCALKM